MTTIFTLVSILYVDFLCCALFLPPSSINKWLASSYPLSFFLPVFASDPQVTPKLTWHTSGSTSISRPTTSYLRSSRTSCSTFTKPPQTWLTRRCTNCRPIECPVRASSRRSMRSRTFMKTGVFHGLPHTTREIVGCYCWWWSSSHGIESLSHVQLEQAHWQIFQDVSLAWGWSHRISGGQR